MDRLQLLQIQRCEEEFEKALALGQYDRARLIALRCSELLRRLASENLSVSHILLEQARAWEQKAKNIHKRKEKRKDEYVDKIKILIKKSTVTWNDIGGLSEAKKLVSQAVGLSIAKSPVEPPQGILLFGPPGTGKSLLASAVANGLNATFFSVKASDLLSKYFGESSKLVSALFSLARQLSPSVIFIDEVDSLTMKRTSLDDAARRMIGTLLAEIDGFKDSTGKVILLTATNAPWDLDEAMLSRLPIRIYVPLPDVKAAVEIFKIHLRGLQYKLNLIKLAKEAVKRLYSGREIANVVKLASMKMLEEMNPELMDPLKIPSLTGKELAVRPLEMNDFKEAFKKVKSPVTKMEIRKYEKWAREFAI
ncbi:cell division protein [Thermococcus chitonophagus]|uniref:Cell division protein n=1 Tax=Thermococcus chitonophagus TaxID=54262 RepID=A0A160VT67_9EURY|nr:ATP-binding protein [Thermococcus chitonophagus]ASJ16803.1 cell division protein [Thermococcus chitonophagus]CUX78275.1 Cell division protein FtsH [Thermococcus chitonophagus]